MSENKYKKVVDGLIKGINNTWITHLQKSKIGKVVSIKLPIKKIDDININVYLFIHNTPKGCYVRINIKSNNINIKNLFYAKNFTFDSSSETELYNFFNDLENLKLDYHGNLAKNGDNIEIDILNSFDGLVIEGIIFDDIDDKKCCVCKNFTNTKTLCNHHYCYRCRSKNVEITQNDNCPICRKDLNNKCMCSSCNDEEYDEDEDEDENEDEDEDENEDEDEDQHQDENKHEN